MIKLSTKKLLEWVIAKCNMMAIVSGYDIIYQNKYPVCMFCDHNLVGVLESENMRSMETIYTKAWEGPCNIKEGCGPCLELVDGGNCPSSLDDDYLCFDTPGFLCQNGKLTRLKLLEQEGELSDEQHCEPCRLNPLAEGCVQV